MNEDFIKACQDITLPVLEQGMTLAAKYSIACNRTSVTSTDVEYCMKYAGMNLFGEKIGSIYPEIYEDSDSSDESDIEEVDESLPENQFTRYQGDDELMNKINEAYDNWDNWKPQSPIEMLLKKSIDSQNNGRF